MGITENYDIPRIRGDIAKCRQRIAQMEAGTAGVIPEGARHVDAGQAFGNQLAARYKDLSRLAGELVQAMIASSKWPAADIIEAMEAVTRPPHSNEVDRHISGHIYTAGRHLGRGHHDKVMEHLVAATQLCESVITIKETT